MEYLTYKKYAEQYIIDNYGTLDVLRTYNKSIEEKLHSYMLSTMLKAENPIGVEIKKVMNECKEHGKRFMREYQK